MIERKSLVLWIILVVLYILDIVDYFTTFILMKQWLSGSFCTLGDETQDFGATVYAIPVIILTVVGVFLSTFETIWISKLTFGNKNSSNSDSQSSNARMWLECVLVLTQDIAVGIITLIVGFTIGAATEEFQTSLTINCVVALLYCVKLVYDTKCQSTTILFMGMISLGMIIATGSLTTDRYFSESRVIFIDNEYHYDFWGYESYTICERWEDAYDSYFDCLYVRCDDSIDSSDDYDVSLANNEILVYTDETYSLCSSCGCTPTILQINNCANVTCTWGDVWDGGYLTKDIHVCYGECVLS